MNGAVLDVSNENLKSIKEYQQILLNQALTQGIQRNEEQFKVWTEYKKRHKKVIEALEKLPLEVTINCMVPIGKRAFMKGKLIHTNEILACLGENYFAKYSAAQAIALCNRRIECMAANEMLKNLEKERNLYEMRQFIPQEFDVFGEKERADLVEHWDEKKLDDWRAEHRQREKEYHKKLSELRKKGKTDIQTEEDLFERLDELELQEELADEINRLEDERERFYGEELQEGEVYYESDEEESSNDDNSLEEIEKELNKLKEIRMGKNTNEPSVEINVINTSVHTEKEISNSNSKKTEEVEKALSKTISEVSCNNYNEDETLKIAKSKSMSNISNDEIKLKEKRRVSFVEPDFSKYNDDSKIVSIKNQEGQCTELSNDDLNASEDDNDIIRIEFKHTDNNLYIPEFTENKITSPRDIYKMFSKPKSILKRSPNDIMPPQNTSLPTYSSGEEEEENEAIKPSAYNFIVKDICEKELATSKKKNIENIQDKKLVSRFRMERSTILGIEGEKKKKVPDDRKEEGIGLTMSVSKFRYALVLLAFTHEFLLITSERESTEIEMSKEYLHHKQSHRQRSFAVDRLMDKSSREEDSTSAKNYVVFVETPANGKTRGNAMVTSELASSKEIEKELETNIEKPQTTQIRHGRSRSHFVRQIKLEDLESLRVRTKRIHLSSNFTDTEDEKVVEDSNYSRRYESREGREGKGDDTTKKDRWSYGTPETWTESTRQLNELIRKVFRQHADVARAEHQEKEDILVNKFKKISRSGKHRIEDSFDSTENSIIAYGRVLHSSTIDEDSSKIDTSENDFDGVSIEDFDKFLVRQVVENSSISRINDYEDVEESTTDIEIDNLSTKRYPEKESVQVDIVTRFLRIIENQHLLGENCTAGTDLNLGEGVVDRYAQERFRLEANLAVNRANMLTRLWKYAPEVMLSSEYLLHASVLSMVEFDEDIFAAGNCYDKLQYKDHWLYCPFAHRLQDQEGVLVKDLAIEYKYLSNSSEWFYIARKNAERVIASNNQFSRDFPIPRYRKSLPI
ncbi:unconventional prefoldin RPB5 interactor-like protein isoform X1 [Vespula squamosa]|uniref:Unconventional prefoldin RPB5 interactor-like protein isoform X1 n=1 Tax=Vespula squamosa TaxID=30214 RepID=A0ABD1ZZV6_VESSQ